MSLRRSLREKHPPNRYSPDNMNNLNSNNKPLSSKQSLTSKNTTTSSQRRLLQIQMEQIEAKNKLEKEMEERKLQRQKEFDQKEMERKRLEMELEMERQQEARELERQEQLEAGELERQKRLLQARTELESASVSSQHSYKVGGSLNLEEDEEESLCKVERWLDKKEPTVLMSAPPIETTAVQRLADSLRHVIQPVSLPRQQLPNFTGKPDEWPMFYSTYLKTVNLFSEDDNLARVRNCLEGEAYKMVKPLFVSSKNLTTVIKTLQMRFGRPEFVLESMMKKTRMLLPVKEDDTTSLIEFSTNILNLTTTAESLHLDSYMINPQLLNELLCKLPYSLKYRWAEHVSSSNIKSDLNEFSNWLEKQCSIMSIYFRPPDDNPPRRKSDCKPVFTNVSKENRDRSKSCLFCQEPHDSEKCKLLRKAEISKRWQMVVEKKLCLRN